MKRVFIIFAFILVAVDLVAFYFWYNHNKASKSETAFQVTRKPEAATPAPAVKKAPKPKPAKPELSLEGRRDKSEYRFAGMRTPGGCATAAECATYCGNPEHESECMSFVGMKTQQPEQPQQKKVSAKTARAQAKKLAKQLREAGPVAERCLYESIDPAHARKLLQGTGEVTPQAGQAAAYCIKKGHRHKSAQYKKQQKHQQQGGGGEAQGFQDGPAGCTNIQECTKVCQNPQNFKECLEWEHLPPQFRSMMEQMIGQ